METQIVIVVIGFILWGVILLSGTFWGEFTLTLNEKKMKIKNPILRFFILLLIIPLTGCIFWGVGWFIFLIGKIIISPLIYIF